MIAIDSAAARGSSPMRDVVLDADVQPFGVLADQHEVEVLVAPAGNDRVRRAHVGVEVERLAQRDVDRAVAFADRRLERTLERELGALDRVERRVGNRIAVARDAGHAGDLRVPLDVGARRFEDAHRRALIDGPMPSPGMSVTWCRHSVR